MSRKKKSLPKNKDIKEDLKKGREGGKEDFFAVLKRMVTSPKI